MFLYAVWFFATLCLKVNLFQSVLTQRRQDAKNDPTTEVFERSERQSKVPSIIR